MLELLVLLRELSWEVTFAARRRSAAPEEPGVLRAHGIEVVAESTPPEEHLRAHGARYAAILLSRSNAAHELIDPARRYAPDAHVIFDTVDLAHVREFRQARHFGNAPMLATALTRKAAELEAIRAADCTIVVSDLEREFVLRESPVADVRVISIVHEPVAAARPHAERSGAVFVGNYRHAPNDDAMHHLLDDVWPLVSAQQAGLRLHAVGSFMPDWLATHRGEDVVVQGHVPVLADVYAERRLSVAPLRFGAGVKGKVVSSLAHGCPVVGSPVAFEGMPVAHEREVLVAETAAQTAAAVVRLHADEGLWQSMSDNARRTVAEHYSKDAARRGLAAALACGARSEVHA